MKNPITLVKDEIKDTSVLMRNVPSGVMVFFVISVVLMNLLANKEIATGIDWLALDCGFTLSWMSFLCMDILTRRFGPKASIKLSLFALMVNLLVSAILKAVSLIPGNWAEFYSFENDIINQALNNTIGGTWYVLFGSAVAFVVSAIVNAVLNHLIGKMCRKKSFREYALRSYISTLLAQFIDNLIFALIVSYNFFGWTMLQCITCSITGCVAELLCEVIFSPIGYRVSQKWETDGIGSEYVDSRRAVKK